MVHIYYSVIDFENHEVLLENYLHSFSENFKNRICKYRRWQDAQLSLLGRMLLRYGLKEFGKDYYDIQLSYNEYRKPYLEDESVEFNISHSGNIVVCAIHDHCEIGIDIEMISDIEVKDFKAQMTQKEWEHICNSKDKQNAFMNFWTQKEAVIKANGMGLSLPLDSFEVSENRTQIEKDTYHTQEIAIDPNYKCHIAFKNIHNEVVLKPEKKFFA